MAQHPDRGVARPPRTALALLLLASTLTVMAGSIITPVIEVIRGDLGVSGTAAGLVLTAHGLAVAVVSPLTGWAIDRWGVRGPLAGGLLIYGLAGGFGLVTDSYAALITSRLIFGVGAAAVFTGTTVALLSMYAGTDRDRVMGWRSTAISLGGVLWPLIGGAVGGLSWHAPFAVYLVAVPIGVATLAVLPARTEIDGARARGRLLPALRDRPVLLTWYGLLALATILLYVVIAFLPARLAQTGVTAPFAVSLYVMVLSLSGSLVGLVYARLRAWLSYLTLVRLSLAGWAAALLLAGAVDSRPVLIAALVTFGFATGVAVPALTVLIGVTAPLDVRGQATSLAATATFVGQFLSPLMVGPLIGATSVRTGFVVAAAVTAAVILVTFALRYDDSAPADESGPEETAPESGRPSRDGTVKEPR